MQWFLSDVFAVSSTTSVTFCCGALILCSEILILRPQLWDLLLKPVKSSAGDEEDDGIEIVSEKKAAAAAAPPPPRAVAIKPGSRVRIKNLVKATQYNEQEGIVKASDGDRWVVKLDEGKEVTAPSLLPLPPPPPSSPSLLPLPPLPPSLCF
eukprot:762949-Hanusia_phi.AAC.6